MSNVVFISFFVLLSISSKAFEGNLSKPNSEDVGSEDAKAHFCSAVANDPSFFQVKLQDFEINGIGFANPPGYRKDGLCWWTSRFQRNAVYLSVFKPELSKPSQTEIRELVRQLIANKHVVEIPGYSSIREFTTEQETIITDELSKWEMREDGFWQGEITTLVRSTQIPEKLSKQMDELYVRVTQNHEIVYQMLKGTGIGNNHAWLVLQIKRLSNGGYELTTKDPNFPNTLITYIYRVGDSYFSSDMSFPVSTLAHFVPHTRADDELRRSLEAVSDYCLAQ